jgi:hypothetical protein
MKPSLLLGQIDRMRKQLHEEKDCATRREMRKTIKHLHEQYRKATTERGYIKKVGNTEAASDSSNDTLTSEKRFQFTIKEALLTLAATALALGSCKADDPLLFIPMLLLSWVAFILICILHKGKAIFRLVCGVAISIVLLFVGWRINKTSKSSADSQGGEVKSASLPGGLGITKKEGDKSPSPGQTPMIAPNGTRENSIGPTGASKKLTASSHIKFDRHDLSKDEVQRFVALLASQTEKRERISIDCPANSEADCIYAGKFIDLFKAAGWAVVDSIVHRVTLGIPYAGVVIGVHSDAAFDPNQKVGTGHWVKLTPSQVNVREAFLSIGVGTKPESADSIMEGTIQLYFGPEQTENIAKKSFEQSALELKRQRDAMKAMPHPQ